MQIPQDVYDRTLNELREKNSPTTREQVSETERLGWL